MIFQYFLTSEWLGPGMLPDMSSEFIRPGESPLTVLKRTHVGFFT